ncbi:MAG TPA: hypothetical protein VME01_06370, partial [Solirubrobacteraceae bacterium]|nr:hypothetical protein [Solirubrobacteraceae bacterium]
PVALAAVYVLLILVNLPGILNGVWLSSDTAIDAVLAHMAQHAPAGALLSTGDFPHYETIAFALLTRSLSFYRPLWMLVPVLAAIVAVAAVGWSVDRAFGRWPAALSVAVLVCFGGGGHAMITAGGLATIFSYDSHGNSVVTAALCGAALTYLLPRATTLPASRLVAAALLIGVLGGLPLAGDTLYLAWGLLPLVVVTVLCAWRGPQRALPRVLGFGLGTILVTGVSAAVFAAIMRGQGVRGYAASFHTYLTFATPSQLVTNFETLAHALPLLGGADFYGASASLGSELQLAAAMLLFVGLVAVLARVRSLVAAAPARPEGGGEPPTERFVHVTWWSTVLVAGIVVVLIGSPNPISTDGRYVLGPFLAIAALLPLLLNRGLGWRLLVSAGATVFVANALFQFHPGVIRGIGRGYSTTATARALADYARREHVAVGYGDYWNSINLTWNSDFRVDVLPVQTCNTRTARLCTFYEISLSGWNRPRPGVRSMLVADPHGPLVKRAPRNLGRPLATRRIGSLVVYVYPYDIASRFKYDTKLTY